MYHTVAVLALYFSTNALATATRLEGTVINGTTGKPAAGHEVVILSKSKGMTESWLGETNAMGRFSIAVDDARALRLVRVVHQGVAYQTMAPPGVRSVRIQIYDVARELDGVTATEVQRLQTEGAMLQVIEEILVRNASNPPRTLMRARTLEIQLPPEAKVLAGKVQLSGGRPLTRKPTPGDREGRYYFPFPLLPGNTRFAVAYLLPYQGEAVIEPKILYPLERFTVVVPSSLKFEEKTVGSYEVVPSQAGADVRLAATRPGQHLAFRISGKGTVEKAQSDGRQQPGRSIDLDSPSDRWFFLGGLALVLVAAALGAARAYARSRERSPRVSAWRNRKRSHVPEFDREA